VEFVVDERNFDDLKDGLCNGNEDLGSIVFVCGDDGAFDEDMLMFSDLIICSADEHAFELSCYEVSLELKVLVVDLNSTVHDVLKLLKAKGPRLPLLEGPPAASTIDLWSMTRTATPQLSLSRLRDQHLQSAMFSSISVDGKFVAYLYYGDLYVYPLQRAIVLRLSRRTRSLPLTAVSWSSKRETGFLLVRLGHDSWEKVSILSATDVDGPSLAWSNHCLPLSKDATTACGDEQRALYVDSVGRIEYVDLSTGAVTHCQQIGHYMTPSHIGMGKNAVRFLSVSFDAIVVWDANLRIEHRIPLNLPGVGRRLESVACAAWSPCENFVLVSPAASFAVSLVSIEEAKCVRIFEGHNSDVSCMCWHSDCRHAVSADEKGRIIVWDALVGTLLVTLHSGASVSAIGWSWDGSYVISSVHDVGLVHHWDVTSFINVRDGIDSANAAVSVPSDNILYMNAKVLIVGDSSAGKTGLAQRLAENTYDPSCSTVGAWSTQWSLARSSAENVFREILLWDFGGQADQRLIHQLFMSDASLVVLVVDPQKDDVEHTIQQWNRAIAPILPAHVPKLLVAGRVDAGGWTVSRDDVVNIISQCGFYDVIFETSAKFGDGCDELRAAIVDVIPWDRIPWRTSSRTFKRVRDELMLLKNSMNRLVVTVKDLLFEMQRRIGTADVTKDVLSSVISLLAVSGEVMPLDNHSMILLKPGILNIYGQALIKAVSKDTDQRGWFKQEQLLEGHFVRRHNPECQLDDADHFLLLRSLDRLLSDRAICLREQIVGGTVLVFPSLCRRARAALAQHPPILYSYSFMGYLDEVYATLIVNLHYADDCFKHKSLYRYAADFHSKEGKILGLKMMSNGGSVTLDLFFDVDIPVAEKIIFTSFIDRHVKRRAKDVQRVRQYVCLKCCHPVNDTDAVQKRLAAKQDSIICSCCEKRVSLFDDIERHFDEGATQTAVTQMEQQALLALDNESKGRILVGVATEVVAKAGQIFRECQISDHGIDGEIEFKDDQFQALGRRVFLQLKSGDSYIQKRKRTGKEVFKLKDERHATYWRQQPGPVFLVVRQSDGTVRWMNITDYLNQIMQAAPGVPIKQIEFSGEEFTPQAVLQLRNQMCSLGGARQLPGSHAAVTAPPSKKRKLNDAVDSSSSDED
jgi:small GTP-binding protein